MRTLRVAGKAVDLTTFEYRLLEQLMLNAGQTLSRTELAEHLYTGQPLPNRPSLDGVDEGAPKSLTPTN